MRERKKNVKNCAKKWPYCIPMIRVQDVLVYLDINPKVVEMRKWCDSNCDEAWSTTPHLEKRWYLEFSFKSRWDAAAFMHKFKKYM